MRVFTLGYQGLTLEAYSEILVRTGVGIVLDVRETPFSYNRRYIGSVMKRALADAGVGYLHLKACGNPSINRKTAKSPEECLSMYREYLARDTGCLTPLLSEIEKANGLGEPACLTCYEREPHACHRTILLEFLLDQTPELEVMHLVPDQEITVRTAMASTTFSGTTSQLR